MFGLSAIEARIVEYAVIAIVALLGYGYWSHQLREQGAQKCRADQVLADQREEQRRTAAQKEIDLEAQRLATRARADSERLDRATARVRPVLATLFGRCDPTVASVGPPASSADDLRADLRSRLESDFGATLRYADDAVRAVGECAARYETLDPAVKR